ncbi:MAG: cytochrome P450 [Frankia sp.]
MNPGPTPRDIFNPTDPAAGSVVFDAFDPEHRADPYPRYEIARAATALHPTSIGVHLATRYADCFSIFNDARWSHAQEGDLLHPDVAASDLPASFLWMDPPDHTRLRGLVSRAFTPRMVAGLRPRIEQIVSGLVDHALDKGEIDVVSEMSYPLPLHVIGQMLGVPAADYPTVQGWSRGIARGFDPDALMSEAEKNARLEAARGFVGYFWSMIVERRAHPTDDLISALVAVRDSDDDLLSDVELVTTCVLLMNAGYETTVNLVANGMLALLRNPDQLDLLRAQPDLAARAVDELLRYDAPIHIATRVASEPIELAGHTFARGEGVLLLLASANRDPAAYPDPDRLDLTRFGAPLPAPAVPRQLGFGMGMHFCLGAPLARLEMEVLLRALVARVGKLELASEHLVYKTNVNFRGLESLPVRFG